MRIDLHAHSNVSDGTETPAGVIVSAVAAGLDAVALTDHDSTDGWESASAAAREHGVAFVPGMEISCRTEEGISVHLLSYLHDPAHEGLLEEITKSKDARLTRAEHMVTLLSEDYPLTWDDVIHHVAPGATVGRPHIADALVAAGVVADRTEAFTSILTSHSRYFVQHYAPNPALAVELVRAAGGVPVFAHPVASSRGRIVGERTYRDMIDAGLLGLEVEHRDNPEEGRAFLRGLAAEHGLLMTGSSDYHGAGKPNLLGENTTSPEVLARIEELASGTTVVR
ncbi:MULTISPECIES: PHP domain-containing protein [Paenarthrobacter]|uniref:Metal-dependent phosphoesterase TrpH n=1 Tax=Paenarthrobacter nicotinovorans TaxID=29320 RepID=A0ABT9THC9_PAENI|nr:MULTISPECIES: PHP domain-containing protein [Paenarthrobacter]BCW11422.1 metal-dependent phosphoesterase [Arthrobacter sp. NtRootA2]BCW15506.1 metal-dependent phosphoesterase [Arthrobacter sp. NtRootA4]BCW23841.1 metal-dependent phosphoesterase [Arthrobacter sp. NtRootC7]BCW28108.1 metal-dependent phosphoesterase [Arthrobacter sp. NtRootC45]BCW32378.1 metal-dependent phosphoesterase [Arthrobacter sp. NtRootD5]